MLRSLTHSHTRSQSNRSVLIKFSSLRTTRQLSSSSSRQAVIVSAARTPVGSFGGSLATLRAPQLGAIAIREAVARAGIPAEMVQEAYMGNVCSAAAGQAPGRQAVIGAGLSTACITTTVNKVCASGMKAIALASMSIQLGISDVLVAGGFESMTNVPYAIEKGRFGGYRYGNGQLIDCLVTDGLWDPYSDQHMGMCAEKCAAQYKISREEQDAFTVETIRRTFAAVSGGHFAKEIVPVSIKTKAGETVVSVDEEPSRLRVEKIPQLQPAFLPEDGTVTAATSSSINDGGCALVIMSAQRAQELSLKPLARIVSFADAEQAPMDFPTSPALALPKALGLAGLSVGDVDLWEINQAFSVVSIANIRLLKLDPAKVDVTGGALALGHPIGCSGARIVCTLLHNLMRLDKRFGAAAICNGGGGASAIVIERL